MLKSGLVFLLASAALCPALAADEGMSFQVMDGFILADGVFANDTDQKFTQFLADNGKAEGTWNIPLAIRSPGGNLMTAINMGNMIRAHGMSVIAFDHCESACTYMVMGGVNRVVAKGAQYGVHQFFNMDALAEPDKPYFSANEVAQQQDLLAGLHDYAQAMGVDTNVVAIASHTPPPGVTYLTREQLVNFRVDNVPSADPEGQAVESIVIPGVTAAATPSFAPPDLVPMTLAPGGLAGIVSIATVRRLIMAETLDAAGMEAGMANSYAFNVEYDGRLWPADAVMAEKRRMVAEWGYRRRVIDEATWHVECSANDISCTVTGEYDSELGLSADGFVSKSRWRFTYEVVLPMALPRVAFEKVAQVGG
jgi:hypothetical protein